MDPITMRPVSRALSQCSVPGERCASGTCIWASPTLEGSACHLAANRIYDAYHDGKFDDMLHLIQILDKFARDIDRGGAWQLVARNLLGTLQLARGEVEAALATFEQTAELASHPDRYDACAPQLQEALYGWALACYDIEHIQEFERVSQHFVSLVAVSGCQCVDDIRMLMLSALRHLFLGAETNAASCFQQIISRYQYVAPFYCFVATFGLAECALRNGDITSAQAQLEALNHGIEHNQRGSRGAILAWLPRFPRALALIQRSFNHWQAIPDEVLGLAKLPVTRRSDADLRVHAFGNGEVYLGESYRDFSGARPSLILLAYLAMYPEGVRSEYIVRALWPQATDDQSFKRALGYLRRLLYDRAVECNNTVYRLNPELRTWLDVTAFLEIYQRALKLAPGPQEDALVHCAALYKGPFLQIAQLTWVDEMRNKLQLKMAAVWWHIAKCAATRGDVERSIEYLEKVLEIDPLNERGVASLMRQWDHSGNRAAAIRIYHTHENRMHKTWGARPSPQLQALYRRLMNEDEKTLTSAFSVAELQQAMQRSTPPLLPNPMPNPTANPTPNSTPNRSGSRLSSQNPQDREADLKADTSAWIN